MFLFSASHLITVYPSIHSSLSSISAVTRVYDNAIIAGFVLPTTWYRISSFGARRLCAILLCTTSSFPPVVTVLLVIWYSPLFFLHLIRWTVSINCAMFDIYIQVVCFVSKHERREFLREILYNNIDIIAIQHSKTYFVDTFGNFSHTVE